MIASQTTTNDTVLDSNIFAPLVYNVVHFLYEDENRYGCFFGGAAAGKSYSIQQTLLLVDLNMENVKGDTLVIRQTAATHRDSTYKLFQEIAAATNTTHLYKWAFSSDNRRITSKKTGRCIVFRGLDDPAKLTSIAGFSRCFIEEASEIKESAFDILDDRLRGIEGIKIIIAFNPVRKDSWLRRNYFIKGKKYSHITTRYKVTYKDNEYLTEQDVKRFEVMQRVNPNHYYVFGLGLWGVPRTDNPYYYNFGEARHLKRIAHREPLPHEKVVFAFDFNLNIMATLLIYIDEQARRISVMHEFPKAKDTAARCQQILGSQYAKYLSRCIITGDSNKSSSVADGNYSNYVSIVSRLGILNQQVKVRNANISHRTSNLMINFFLSEWNIEISDLCTNLVMDLNATETDADFARLKKKHDPHFAECLEYTVVNLLERYMQSTYGTKIAQKLANS